MKKILVLALLTLGLTAIAQDEAKIPAVANQKDGTLMGQKSIEEPSSPVAVEGIIMEGETPSGDVVGIGEVDVAPAVLADTDAAKISAPLAKDKDMPEEAPAAIDKMTDATVMDEKPTPSDTIEDTEEAAAAEETVMPEIEKEGWTMKFKEIMKNFVKQIQFLLNIGKAKEEVPENEPKDDVMEVIAETDITPMPKMPIPADDTEEKMAE